MEHTQTENYDLSQPICENPQLALWALEQIIQANKDGNDESPIFMTVKRCQTCGAWPTCRLDSDGQHVTIVIECSQNTNHPRIIGLWHETVKDIIRTWNHQNSNPFMEDRETRNIKSETERAYTQQQLDSYSMAAPISQDVNFALAVLKQIIQENMQDQCIATLPIRRCPQCNELPTCRLDAKSVAIIMECVQDGHQHSYYCSRSNDSLTEIIIEWNKMQDIVGNLKSVKEPKEDSMETTIETINNYNWNEPISKNPGLAYEALKACLSDNFSEDAVYSPQMKILRNKTNGEMPKAFIDKNTHHVGIGIAGSDGYWSFNDMSLTDLVNMWNKAQEADEKHNGEDKTEITQKMIDEYDWEKPIGEDMQLAAKVLEDCLEQKKNGGHPKKHIHDCHICEYSPYVFHGKDTVSLGCGDPRHARFVLRDTFSLQAAVCHWNEIQEAGHMKHSCDIVNDINTYIKEYGGELNRCHKSFGLEYINGLNIALEQQVDDDIMLCATCGQPPFASYFGEKIILGCQSKNDRDNFVSIYKDTDETAHDLIMKWNALQMFLVVSKHDIFHFDIVGKVLKEHGYKCIEQAIEAETNDDDDNDITDLEAELDAGAASHDDAAMLRRVHTPGTKEHEDAVLEETRQKIVEVCDSIKELLLEKNRKYGNSALNPCRIFARSDRLEQIKVRIDDKLNRIKNEQGDEDEDVVKDLIGYLVLYQVAKMEG